MAAFLISNGKFVLTKGKFAASGQQWEPPVKDDDKLTVRQVYAATKINEKLEIE